MAKSAPLHGNIHKLILSQALSKLGDNFTEVALALFILSITHNNVADLGLVLSMAYLPRVALGWAVAGIINRLPKRRVLLLSDVIRALLVASIPIIRSYDWTLIAVFLMYSFAMVYQPILWAVQPEIAGDPDINTKSVIRQEIYYAVADIGAYVAAAGVLFFWGISPAFWVDAATYVGAAFFIFGIRVSEEVWKPMASQMVGFWRQLGEGARYLMDDNGVVKVVLLAGVASVAVAAMNTLIPDLSHQLWGISSKHYVWLVLSMACGGLFSGTLIERGSLANRWSERTLLATGFLLTGLGFAVVLVSDLWLVGVLSMVVVGFGNTFYSSALVLWIQRRVPGSIRARVLAVRGIGLGLGGAVGATVGGWLGHRFGMGVAVLTVSLLWLVITGWTVSSPAFDREKQPERVA